MKNELTPLQIKERATAAHIPISKLLERAGVQKTTFWRWSTGETSDPHPVTLRKIADALEAFEAEKAA